MEVFLCKNKTILAASHLLNPNFMKYSIYLDANNFLVDFTCLPYSKGVRRQEIKKFNDSKEAK